MAEAASTADEVVDKTASTPAEVAAEAASTADEVVPEFALNCQVQRRRGGR